MKNPLKNFNGLLNIYAVVLTIAFSRGIFQIFNAKIYGYILQLSALLLMVVLWACFFGRYFFNKRSPFVYFICLLFLSSLAAIFTLFSGHNSIETIFTVFTVNMINLFFLVVTLVVLKYQDIPSVKSIKPKKVNQIILFLSMYVSILSIMQYLGFIDFPGYWFIGQGDNSGEVVRLSGPVGSKQHLSLLMSLLSSLVITIYFNSRILIHGFIALLSIVTLVLTFTRIGYLVIAINLFLYALYYYKDISKLIKSKLIYVISISSFLFLIFFPRILFFFALAFSRLISITNTSEVANTHRIFAINRGLELFARTPIFISDSLGSASQIPKQILNLSVFHYETAQIQYLINFGLIFTLFVGFIFLRWAFLAVSLYRNPKFCAFIPLGLYAATFAYMYNEIVPIFVLMPMVSICIVSQSQSISASIEPKYNNFI